MPLSREERIAATEKKIAEMRQKLKADKAAIAQTQRKIENKEKYDLGGLVKVAFPGEVDKEFVLGMLLDGADLLTKPDKAGIVLARKAAGKKELDRRAAERKNAKMRTAAPPAAEDK